jgi:hypothetical protein
MCVFVALGFQHAMRTFHTAICDLYGYTIFFHIISSMARFLKKEPLLKIKCVFWFSLQILSETFLILRRTERYMNKNVYWYSLVVPVILVWLIKLGLSQQVFKKKKNIKNAKLELSLSKRTDAMEVRVAFHNFTNAHNYWRNFDEFF